MRNTKCLYCYQELEPRNKDFHNSCSKTFFGSEAPPTLDVSLENIVQIAQLNINQRISVTGVQPKLSLDIAPKDGDPATSRLTIVGLWGNYILKPPTDEYPFLPENESITMNMASDIFPTAEHSLIRLKSGELAYITKRFDRITYKTKKLKKTHPKEETKQQKLAMEDMCQLTETQTTDKYRSSMEKIGKIIFKYSTYPGIDADNFLNMVLFSFLTGNADMHLKNFSLLTDIKGDVRLSPAYDLICSKIAMPSDKEESALTINGKKAKLKIEDFHKLAYNLGIRPKNVDIALQNFASMKLSWLGRIDLSFLPENFKQEYKKIIEERFEQIGLSTIN